MDIDSIDTIKFDCAYKNGSGRASTVFDTDDRIKFMKSIFGCRMFGTFNISCGSDIQRLILASEPSYRAESGNASWRFYLCDLASGSTTVPAWMIHWMGPNKRSLAPSMEIISKELIPDMFKKNRITVSVYVPWTKDKVKTWAAAMPKSAFFQTFDWTPSSRADSKMVWDTIRDRAEWAGRHVLDIGPHTGYFSFAASRLGAIVSSFEPNAKVRKRMETIGRHIENQDIKYLDMDNNSAYDTIMYLSVHHQPDPGYKTLKEKVENLKDRCKDLFRELIVPSLDRNVSREDVDRLVQSMPIKTYKHKVRCDRSIYHIKGNL